MKKKDILWHQLSNSINLRSSQDQVLWNIIGTFGATNAILLVALFSQGEPPKNNTVGIVISLVGLILSAVLSQTAIAQQSRPNFIVIMADDLGYGDLGIYGSELIKTPNLDRMALNGARLDSFYSSSNVCTAARVGRADRA